MSESSVSSPLWPNQVRLYVLRRRADRTWAVDLKCADLEEAVSVLRVAGCHRLGLAHTESVYITCGALPPPHQEVVFEWQNSFSQDLSEALRKFHAEMGLTPPERSGKTASHFVCRCGMIFKESLMAMNGWPEPYLSFDGLKCCFCAPINSLLYL